MSAKVQILVVDDDREMVVLLRDFLTQQGYVVATATSGKSALSSVKKGNPRTPQLVLSDVKMSPINGLELTAALQLEHPNLPIILFSAYSDGGLAQAATEAGARVFINKPFGLTQMAELIEKELGEIATRH